MTEKQRRRDHRVKQLAQYKAAEAAKPAPKVDALVKAVAGTPLAGVIDNPAVDPLWLSDEQFARRQSIMRQMDDYQNSPMACGFIDHKIIDGGHEYRASEYLVWQHKTAYNLLTRGVDPRAVAAAIHRDVPWIEAIAEKFNITHL
jgi:hypothetical protein